MRGRIPGKITDTKTFSRHPALHGYRVPIRPHLGTAEVAPDVKGRVSTILPGTHSGNIDNWSVGAGAIMYHPVALDRADGVCEHSPHVVPCHSLPSYGPTASITSLPITSMPIAAGCWGPGA